MNCNFDSASRFRIWKAHGDFSFFAKPFRRAKEEFMISCGAAFEFETFRHRFCDISTVVIFEHPDDLILSCVSWIQAIREIEVFFGTASGHNISSFAEPCRLARVFSELE